VVTVLFFTDMRAEQLKDRENGKGGGNPKLKGGVNPPIKPRVQHRAPARRSPATASEVSAAVR
jgi:hypothetical protein